MSESEKDFSSVYRASEENNIAIILEKYQDPDECADDFEKLKKLDRKVEEPAKITAVLIGLLGFLVFGASMSRILCLSPALIDIAIGICGIVIVICAYPLFTVIKKKRQKKYAEQILALADKIKKPE